MSIQRVFRLFLSVILSVALFAPQVISQSTQTVPAHTNSTGYTDSTGEQAGENFIC